MTRRRLLVETAQRNLDLREDHQDEAPWDAVPKLLGDMQTVLWNGHDKVWHARAQRCECFATARDPVAAMRAAVELRTQQLTQPKRRALL